MSTTIAHRIIAVFVVVSAVVFAFFAVSWLLDPAAMVPTGVDGRALYAKFAGGRNLAVDVVVLIVIARRRWDVLGYFTLTMALIQTYDAGLGVWIGEPGSAIAPILNAAGYYLCTAYLLRQRSTAARSTPYVGPSISA